MIVSKNSWDYMVHWEEELSRAIQKQNIRLDLIDSVDRAYSLLLTRLENIERGMPDLSVDDEQAVWAEAFAIHHRTDHGRGASTITPFWAHSSEMHNSCSCFEKAYQAWAQKFSPEIRKILREEEEDAHYFEERD